MEKFRIIELSDVDYEGMVVGLICNDELLAFMDCDAGISHSKVRIYCNCGYYPLRQFNAVKLLKVLNRSVEILKEINPIESRQKFSWLGTRGISKGKFSICTRSDAESGQMMVDIIYLRERFATLNDDENGADSIIKIFCKEGDDPAWEVNVFELIEVIHQSIELLKETHTQ